ncbi:hypothetical protein D3C76_1544760 [compost metagenome]
MPKRTCAFTVMAGIMDFTWGSSASACTSLRRMFPGGARGAGGAPFMKMMFEPNAPIWAMT